jgi:stage V sporulation protein B
MRNFTKSVIIISAFAAATRAIGFIFRIFLSRILGAEMLGVYQMALSIFMVLLTVISSGLPLVISREVAKCGKGDNKKIGEITIAGLVIGLIVSAALCGIVVAFQNLFGLIFTDKRSLRILIALLPAVMASSIYCILRSVWWGQKKFVLLGLTELIEQIARVGLFVLFLGFAFYFGDLANLSAWSFSGACVISAVVVIVIFIKGATTKPAAHLTHSPMEQQSPAVKPGTARLLIKGALPITGVRVISSVAFPIISILLPLRLIAAGWDTASAVSHFGIIVGMMFPLLTIPSTIISALATALVPELSSNAGQQNWNRAQHQIKKSINFTIFINFIFIPAFIALGQSLGTFLFNNNHVGVYLARSAWAMIPLSLSQITAATLNSLNAEKTAMRNYFMGTTALFISVWWLPEIIGADAVVVGLGVQSLIAATLNIFAIKKITAPTPNFNILTQIGKYALIALPAFAAGYFINNLMQTLPTFFALGLSGAVSVGIFITLSMTFNIISLPSLQKTE